MSRRSRKRKLESEDQTMVADGEQDNFFPDELRDEMERMWEIPQIFHFLYLTRESLNIPQLSIYEMERMLSIPRASKQLANIMTCLLSSPITKAKLRKVPPMPYEFWTNILAHKMTSWFKVYHAKHKDATKVLETIGVEPEFWNIFSDVSLLDDKGFEELSFKQRIWLLKTVCDTIMHTRKTVQEDIAKQLWEDQFETVLGVDRYGARYIYFPQFISTDLRIYRHCLDNKILSTARPVPKQGTSWEMSNLIYTRLSRYRKRKSQSHNNSSGRSTNRRENRIEDKDLNSCNNDSATGSFISEDTNLSSTSTCSNNNNNNNNNISLDTINRTRCRSLSKMSKESTLSNMKSSGYGTNTSNDNKFLDDDDSSKKVFKGFSNTQDDNCNIGIINEMLDDLKTEIDEERKVNECESNIENSDNNSESLSHGNLAESCKGTLVDSCIKTLTIERDESERSSENLSGSSKTDDEKLIEIISAESSKLPASVCSKNLSVSDNVGDSIPTSTSKSDDEKLSETKSSDSNISVNSKETSSNIDITFNGSLRASSDDSVSLSEKVVKRECFSEGEVSSTTMQTELNDSTQRSTTRSLRKRMKLRSRYRAMQRNKENKTELGKRKIKEETESDDDRTDDVDDKNSSASEIRLQEDMEDNSDDCTNNSDIGYNLRKSRRLRTDECKQHFNKMLSDLSVSNFQLIVDSVEGLRDLISGLSTNDSESSNTNNAETRPLCEVKLVNKLTELLNSLESVETTLKDTTRKARAKLQREWSNFKEGSVEDQDSSGEGGLSSNWWVLGSQGCPLSAPGDATLQTLPQSAISPFGSKNQQSQSENERENADKSTEQSEKRDSEERRNSGEKSETEAQGRKQAEKEEEQKRKNKQHGKNEIMSNNEDAEPQTRRVLRTRGVSSYTEQFYSDDEIGENELEEWTDVEAVYAAPGTPADTSASHAAPKVRHADDWSETEDSDQDWILPSSRKRKNKRPPANRRLKSFRNKLQNIRENTSQSNVVSSVSPHSAGAKIGKDKSKNNKPETRKSRAQAPINSARVSSSSTVSANNAIPKQVVPSTDTICKIEAVGSVHSELDIKDEGPIYESGENNYLGPNQQQNYVMIKTEPNLQPVSYYVMPPMQSNAIVPGIAPPIQQSYYVQSAPNYVIQNPQPNFLPLAPQQPIFQQQHMIAQPFVNNATYVPYMATTQSQAEYNMVVSRPPMMNLQQDLMHRVARPRCGFNQYNRYAAPRQNLPHLNGAVIRSSTPIRGSCQRPINPRSTKNNVPQQRTPNPKVVPRQKQTSQTSTENIDKKTTSLIVLSDSDDEIEMIITEKTTTTASIGNGTPTSSAGDETRSVPRKNTNQANQQPTVTSDVAIRPRKDVIPPQIIERMNQGGISITPVKSSAPQVTPSANTQIVVVVNETGSHYALALPNGSKLILTPEQVAQIRASNGGKLIL